MTTTDFIGEKVTYDPDGQIIWAVDKKGGIQMLLDVRGWGAIQNLFKTTGGKIDMEKAAKFQDDLGQWISDAINDKLNKNDIKNIEWKVVETHFNESKYTIRSQIEVFIQNAWDEGWELVSVVGVSYIFKSRPK